MEVVTGSFGLHPVTSKACLAGDVIDKTSRLAGYVVLVIQCLNLNEGADPLNFVPVCLVVFTDLVLSFHPYPVSVLPTVAKRLRYGKQKRSEWITYHVLDSVTDGFFAHCQTVTKKVEEMEDEIFQDKPPSPAHIDEKIQMCREQLARLSSVMERKRRMLVTLSACPIGAVRVAQTPRSPASVHVDHEAHRHSVPAFCGPQMRTYLRDVTDHVTTSSQQIEYGKELLTGLQLSMNARAAVSLASEQVRSDTIVKNLTVAMCISLPMSLLPALFGMNINVPFQSNPATGAVGGKIVFFWWECAIIGACFLMAGMWMTVPSRRPTQGRRSEDKLPWHRRAIKALRSSWPFARVR